MKVRPDSSMLLKNELPFDLHSFFNSLNLSPSRWREAQEYDFATHGSFQMFGIDFTNVREFAHHDELVWRYESEALDKSTSKTFYLGDTPIAAEVVFESSDLDAINVAIGSLPQSLLGISLYADSAEILRLPPALCRPNLTGLKLSNHDSLTDLSGLSGLKNLTSLDLRGCSRLTDLHELSGLRDLTSLNLAECRALTDFHGLSGLEKLTSLDLAGCSRLTDLRGLSGLKNLTSLNLAGCTSLVALGLSGLEKLTSLDLRWCSRLTDLRGLSGLKNLTSLNLDSCSVLSDLIGLSELGNLTSLDLNGCKSLSDLSGLSGLEKLTNLNLGGCQLLTVWGVLSGLENLTNLNLSHCHSLTDVSGLSGLENLASLNLTGCSSLTDLSGLSGLKNLASLDLNGCQLLTVWGVLSGLENLTNLNLSHCHSLTDVSGLSGLENLASLNLTECSSLTDLSGLSGLKRLTSLDLRGCSDIRTLLPLKSLSSLESLKFDSDRVRSIEPLRDIATLRELAFFNPPEVAELLAHTAELRSDGEFISMSAGDWLGEAKNWGEGSHPLRNRFATTLGEAFSLLGENAIELPYEEYLQSCAELSSAPWKAWFEGTRMASGQGLMWMRIGRQNIYRSTPGCIGGICSVLGGEGAAPEEVTRSQDWLNSMEECWTARSKELLPVSAEICLACARLGEWEALGRWLVRFTDSSDPSALDPVQDSLARFQMNRDDLVAAEAHIFAVHASQTRDPLLLEFVGKLGASDPEKSSLYLLLVKDPAERAQMGKRLLAMRGFEISETTLHRLIVVMDANPADLADLISSLPEFTPQSLIERISAALQLGSAALWIKLADDLDEKSTWYRSKTIS